MAQKKAAESKQDSQTKFNPFLKWGIIILAIIGLLELFGSIIFAWTIIGLAFCYTSWLVSRQSRNCWKGRHNKVARQERFLKWLASLMGWCLAFGSGLFLLALYYIEGSNFVNAEYLLRSFICSLDLFMLDIDSNILDAIREHKYLKGAISIQAFLSFSCTVAILISLIYARIATYRKLHWKTIVDDEHNHLYIFFGMNEPSRQLIKSIKQQEGEQALVIIVENTRIDEEDRNGWDSIVSLFTLRSQMFSDVNELDARITFTESKLSDVEPKEAEQEDILGELNLIKVRSLIRQLASIQNARLHLFFLSEDENENILSLSTLVRDESINKLPADVTRFYCHARRNGLNRVVEDIAVKCNLEIRIIDSAHIAIETLKSNDEYHPVRLVDTDSDNPTTVTSEFHSLIIGFDEAGQDALRFLYEFGAFVDFRSTSSNVFRSPFHCTAIDVRMKQLSSAFTAFAPTVMMQRNNNHSALVSLKECDCQSDEFYTNILYPVCQKLNYVVIAVGDDELGMTVAVHIFNYIRRFREDLRHFRIFVRSYCIEKEAYMNKIANHYNEGYNTDCKKYQTGAIIIPFGQMDKIYSYNMIINDELVEKGKLFQESYIKLSHDNDTWDVRRSILTGQKKKENNLIKEIPMQERRISLDNICKLRRQESQDIANALHAGTKIYLLKQIKDYDWTRFLDGITSRQGSRDKINYPKLNMYENKAIFNLACLEHLRWNASHEMLGYQKATNGLHTCDERKKQHNCLLSWQEIDDESDTVTLIERWDADYKRYDFCVVDNTILLYKEKLLAP